jgi:protease-4
MADSDNRNESWDKQVLEKLLLSSVQEQRKARQ